MRSRSCARILAGALALLACGCAPQGHGSAAPEATREPVILLLGFEPFGGGKTNASWEAVRVFDGRAVEGYRLVAREIPVEWGAPAARVPPLLDQFAPVAVLAFGQGWPGKICFECVGRNRRGQYRDNRGALPPAAEVAPDGPAFFLSRFPIKEFLPGLKRTGLAVAPSQDAGGYLCNEMLYTLERLRRRPAPEARPFDAAFFHVPALGEAIEVRGRTEKCDAETLRAFVEALVKALARHRSSAQE